MSKLIKYLKPYLIWIIVLLILVFGQSLTNLALPDYTSKIINIGIRNKDISSIWNNGLIMLGITVLSGLLSVGVSFLASRISTGYARKLREEIFKKIENFSLDEFNKFSSSSLITRATNDIQQIQNILSMLMRMSLLAPFLGIGAIVKAHSLAPGMSWIIIVAVSILITLLISIFFMAVPKFKLIQQMVDKIGLQIKEMLTGVRVIRAYNKDESQHKKFNKINLQSTDLNIFVSRFMGMLNPIMTLIMGLSSVGVIWLGSYMIGDGKIDIGNVLALVQYISQAIMSFLMFSIIFILVPRAAVSVKRIGEILNTELKIKDIEDAKHFPKNIKGIVEFKNVNFSYNGSEQSVLNNISFIAKPGETTAIIGGTGSGKTTLLNLITRLYDISSGLITIDGVDIRETTQKELHENISYIPQKSQLFFRTVKENILYGNKDANDEEIKKVIEISQSTDFINSLPGGINADISQSGSNISGGQKQRLTIARALIKKSKIYLFDDSFSALDFKTDAALRKALKNELKDSTVLIVGQRISTIMNADNIIVLNEGKIVGQGKHENLLKTCSIYREIAKSQLSDKELNQKK